MFSSLAMAFAFPSFLCLLFLLRLASWTHASALTTAIGANERLCFYSDVDKAGEKIGVSSLMFRRRIRVLILVLVLFCSRLRYYYKGLLTYRMHSQVQAGGSFDVDFEVKDPNEKTLLDGQRERQGDYVFTANTVGEYSFCFENDMSTLTEKLVDFDIMVESEPRRDPPAKQGQIADQTSALEESIFRLNGMLLNVKRTQKYFHTRENRGFDIVKSTQNRLFWYAVLESLGVVAIAVFQVYILQTFFTKTGRRYKV
ncbi:putative membrane protein C17A5.08 [Grifola frondosa]|uniref:Putative membrane protein C17A5.08 n=1 Tax=Grifola frondosa TaxID=5627 RepID=A0A1C7M9Z0_GRIFR|nr:putative membrane protein C17A5.08 [Grifola frondosa]